MNTKTALDTDESEFTIDGLARAGETTVRSIRVYHERGVLPSPEIRGRIGYYGPDHLNRLRTISRLLSRGVKLNGIKELLDAWDRGEGLAEVLGVTDDPLAEDDAVDHPAPETAPNDSLAANEELRELVGRLVSAGLRPEEAAAEIRRFESGCAQIADLIYRVAAGLQGGGVSSRDPGDWQREMATLRDLSTRVAEELIGHTLRARVAAPGL